MIRLKVIAVLFAFSCIMAFSSKDTYVYIENENSTNLFHKNASCVMVNDTSKLSKIKLVDAERLHIIACEHE